LRAQSSKPFAAPNQWVIAVLLVAAAGFNVPLRFWARNAGDISSPSKPLAIAAILTLVGVALVFLLTRFGIDRQAAGLGVGTGMIMFAYGQTAQGLGLFVPVVVSMAAVMIGHRLRDTRKLDGLILLLIALVGVLPVFQVVFEHAANASSYPVSRPASSGNTPIPTGTVEDVMVVVVDGYPSLRVAAEWFDHDTAPLVGRFSDLGFEVEAEAWSQHTFTAPSVAALLELQPVIAESTGEPWDDMDSLYRITRGDSFVSRTLHTAGFTYTHFDSGWDVTACGDMVDRCVSSPWIDETVAGVIQSTAFGDWIERNLGSYSLAATLHTTDGLTHLGRDLSQNGKHDYIFAHLLLPHDPPVVNQNCQFEEARVTSDQLYLAGELSTDERRRAISDQMTCVDSLIGQIAESVGPSTAVIITADHGSGTGGQVQRAPSQWTDSDIAERFGILLAYRLPSGCDGPSDAINTLVMRAIMTCAVTVDLPDQRDGHLIGLAAPEWVKPSRMQDIQARLSARTLEASQERQ
jgi:hypothetical protein